MKDLDSIIACGAVRTLTHLNSSLASTAGKPISSPKRHLPPQCDQDQCDDDQKGIRVGHASVCLKGVEDLTFIWMTKPTLYSTIHFRSLWTHEQPGKEVWKEEGWGAD
eukprot:CAMPEP_0181326588 /NCGR_PEP_ID=MMETSP1101-20121128/21589_1 /TAXON_ID=46948 /ORGANISM="Rhodomonas abbreviata, Strain Caron Lab Isolate" /LENGTH=107 /DNA_ID=CAMNT_0023435073 /DNA_START=170 /DNA_END=490 /DNA_ORIENTATION=-